MTQDELEKLLRDMTLEEKVGQLVQMSVQYLGGNGVITGPTGNFTITGQEMGLLGSMLGACGAERLREIQDRQMEMQPHRIPMLFMRDVINGHETIFPIPLALGCTFRPELAENMAQISAKEAAASGIHVTFSPMLDLVRDARWGRVMESPGEDTYLNSLMGQAMVRGYQGEDLKEEGRIASCLKHFAGYGAPEGGRDYDNAEISERTLREDYLPAYQAAVKAGCRLAMPSFNTVNRIPAAGNKWLLKDVLREEMGFEGVIISDYSAVEELVNHGLAEDSCEAAKLAIEAGVDIDMVSGAYVKQLAELVRAKEVSEELVDRAVMRVLTLKNDLGLFENPYKGADPEAEKKLFCCREHRKAVRQSAEASFVLLKNEDILPFEAGKRRIALIGPYAENQRIHGSWSFPQDISRIVTVAQGVRRFQPEIACRTGSYVLDPCSRTRYGIVEKYDPQQAEAWLAEAVEEAKNAETVILCLGEHLAQSGESASRTRLTLPQVQMELLRRVHEVNENIVLLLFCGRPLETEELLRYAKALMVVWFPGTEGGNAIANVLFGKASPEGRLAMSFPRRTGQEPIYYNHLATGRPNQSGTDTGYINGYIDEDVRPQFPFGYGLTYTEFAYSSIRLDREELRPGETVTATVTLKNIGKRSGTETVQLYLRDVAGSVARPVRMLKGFQKVTLAPGEEREIRFEITEEMLRFYDAQMHYTSEPGRFEVFIGPDSAVQEGGAFRLTGNEKADRP